MERTINILWEIMGSPFVTHGVVASIVGAILYTQAQALVKYFQSRKGTLAGEWDQIIEDPKTKQIIKRDRIKCRNIKDKLWGTIERLEPADEHNKRWKFEARKKGNMIFGTFWAADLKNNESYGTIQHHMVNRSRLEGFYVKLEVDIQKGKLVSTLKEIPFRWQRCS